MKKILWLVDGVGWSYDILSAAIAKELPCFEHVMLAKKFIRVVIGNGRSGCIYEDDKSFMKRIDEVETDIIVSMNPKNKRFLKNKPKAIVRFSGERAMRGWHR